MMCSSRYISINANEVVEENNHETRNALTPGLSSVELLEHNWERMTSQQRQKHLDKIRNSINNAVAILEKNNASIEEGKILLFRRKS
jgi:uncharacterized protein YukE